jgi:hypothetical protein
MFTIKELEQIYKARQYGESTLAERMQHHIPEKLSKVIHSFDYQNKSLEEFLKEVEHYNKHWI